MYLHIVDHNDKLLGVIDIKEQLQSEGEDHLQDIMETKVITLNQESTLEDASILFDRYDFRSIPVVDNFHKIPVVILCRDVVELKHRFMN